MNAVYIKLILSDVRLMLQLLFFQIQNRKRPSEDTRLNSAITAGVATIPDRAIQLDERVIRNLRKAEVCVQLLDK